MGNKDLPVGSGLAHAHAFGRAGWEMLPRRGRGKHFLLKHPQHREILSIPDHKEVKRTLLAHQVRIAGLTVESYMTFYTGK